MADFNVAMKSFITGLDTVVDPSNKYVMVSDKDGNVLGKIRTNAIVFQDDLVDMGLPSGTLWAKKNIGASKVTDYGLFFSWGNTDGHNGDGVGNYNFSQDVYNATSGATLTTDVPPENDAAKANLGTAWKLPTSVQFDELFNSSYTTNAWVTDYNGISGLNGRLVTSKANGNTLFFPAGGVFDGASLANRGASGSYWSSTRIDGTSARSLYFNASSVYPQGSLDRRYGFSVRAVQ